MRNALQVTWIVVGLFSFTAAQEPAGEAKPQEEEKDKKKEHIKISFEDYTAGEAPKGWVVAENAGAGKPAKWVVEAADKAPDGKNILRLAHTENAGSTYNMLLSEAKYPAGATLTVMLRADTGEEDQGGGLVWRAVDPENYYIARWNPLEKNFRAYKVEGGKRSKPLGSATIEADAKAWHELEVKMKDEKCKIEFDGKKILEFEDTTFKDDGRVGFWTKADAATSFDYLEIEFKKKAP